MTIPPGWPRTVRYRYNIQIFNLFNPITIIDKS